MEFRASKTIKRIAAIVVIVIIGLAGWAIYYANFVFHITGTNPDINRVSSLAPFFKINFSDELAADKVQVATRPAGLVSSRVIDGKTMTVVLSDMSQGEQYTIELTAIESQSGQTIPDQIYTFTAQAIDFDDLPKDQQDYIYTEQDTHPAVNNDPILNYLPHSTLDYTLTAAIRDISTDEGPESEVIVQAELLLTSANVRIDRDAAIARYKQEVEAYLTERNFKPADYTIEYTITEPSL